MSFLIEITECLVELNKTLATAEEIQKAEELIKELVEALDTAENNFHCIDISRADEIQIINALKKAREMGY